ncbi:MotA/TolQ/ExbB proton channel family protein [Marinigracilibium pacificum]|uniref:MotA/TolQ/ExbB proton channel family protein n=1 Tax=Marinigracilibium pacificum TaxID=2729599 RepID=A0A848JCE5_9BACT|nr:MotA/TolQ/ExbB proton channel family protein [Marinigracilibium pacificum]NMM50672.1 MotA/TolQ/ExbB proton channel family protein [Marinigracilibium pacificum]
MKDLFFAGGPVFMGFLSIIMIGMVVWNIIYFVRNYFNEGSDEKSLRKIGYGKSIGLFALIIGILGQLMGMYDAFSFIESTSGVTPALVYSGIKVSMITTLYGLFIYLLSLILWFIASNLLEKKLA